MSLSVGYCGSCHQVRILRRESYISELPRRSNRPWITLKAPSDGWRTWILEEPEAKLLASSVKFKHFCQPFRFDRQSALAHAQVIECADGERSLCSTKGILLGIGRTLFILGLGLSISLPASAWTAAPPISEVSVGDARKKATQSGEVVRERDGDVDSVYSQIDASRRKGIEVTKHPMSNQTDTAETNEEKLLFSEAFWRGIPTPEGSFMHRLKLQLEDNPSDVSALEALLQAVLEQQDMLRALTVIETLLEVQPNNVEWKFLKARTHEFLGELLMAKQEYEELLSLHPLSARFLQGLAKVLNEVGEQTQALELIKEAWDRAISEGKNVEARNLGVLLGQFYIQLGSFEDALRHLSSMIEEDPGDHRPYFCQGLAYALMKEMDKARESFKKYMQFCPPDAFDQNYLDSLFLRAQSSKWVDALKNMAMKSTSRNRKKEKPMKQPSLFGSQKLHDEEYAD